MWRNLTPLTPKLLKRVWDWLAKLIPLVSEFHRKLQTVHLALQGSITMFWGLFSSHPVAHVVGTRDTSSYDWSKEPIVTACYKIAYFNTVLNRDMRPGECDTSRSSSWASSASDEGYVSSSIRLSPRPSGRNAFRRASIHRSFVLLTTRAFSFVRLKATCTTSTCTAASNGYSKGTTRSMGRLNSTLRTINCSSPRLIISVWRCIFTPASNCFVTTCQSHGTTTCRPWPDFEIPIAARR